MVPETGGGRESGKGALGDCAADGFLLRDAARREENNEDLKSSSKISLVSSMESCKSQQRLQRLNERQELHALLAALNMTVSFVG